MNHHRDGQSRHTIVKSNVNYWPNRQDERRPVPPSEGGYTEYPQKVEGIKARVRTPKFQEHFNQAQMFYNSLAPHEKSHLIAAISFELSHCDENVVYEGYTRLLNNIDFDLATQVAINVNGIIPDKPARSNPGKTSAALSQMYYAPKTPTIASRRIAILVADGFNAVEVGAARAFLAGAGAVTFVIDVRRGKINAGAGLGESVTADHHFEGQRSTMFDAVFIPSGAEHANTLASNGRVVHWVREAFGHCKAIGAIGEGVEFLRDVVGLPGIKLHGPMATSDDVVSSYGVVTTGKYSTSSVATDVHAIASGPKGFISNFAYEISKHRCYERELDGLVAQVAY